MWLEGKELSVVHAGERTPLKAGSDAKRLYLQAKFVVTVFFLHYSPQFDHNALNRVFEQQCLSTCCKFPITLILTSFGNVGAILYGNFVSAKRQ